jgi:hypothetical protein
MGVLRQKCVLTYEAFLNNSNFSIPGYNMPLESYLQDISNGSMVMIRLTSLEISFISL